MAKVILDAGYVLSGKAGGLVFCRRGGGVYARARVIPHDPKTKAQRAQRGVFRAAVETWRALPEAEKAAFRKRAEAEGRTGYHLFLAEFLARNGAAGA